MKSTGWVVALFVVTRVALLWAPAVGSDIPIYAGYAVEFEAARQIGASFYAFRTLSPSEKQRHVRGVSTQIAAREGTVFEYPPLALAPMLVPRMAWKAIRGAGSDCSLMEYAFAYRLQMAIIDALLFSGLAWLLRRVYHEAPPRAIAGRLALYVLGGLLLPHLVYDRLDLAFAALLTTALGLLLLARRTPALLVLAVSVAFKMISLPLVPLWGIGSLSPSAAARPASHFGNAARLAGYAAALLTVIAACLAPSYWSGGPQCLAFLEYHRLRGIEIESTYASVMFAARLLGEPLLIELFYGSANVANRFAAILAQLVGPLALLTVGVVAALYYVRARRRSAAQPAAAIAAGAPELTIQMIAACLTALLLSSKVLSPQYLLWLLPLICMLPGANSQVRLIGAVFLALCFLSSLTYPFLLARTVRGFGPGAQPGALAWIGVAVMALRNAGLVALLTLILRVSPDRS